MRVRIPSYVELSRNNHEYPSPLFVALRSILKLLWNPICQSLIAGCNYNVMASVLRCILVACILVASVLIDHLGCVLGPYHTCVQPVDHWL